MAYSSKKAEPADKPNTDVVAGDKPKFSRAQSNQETFTNTGTKAIDLRPSNKPGMRYMETNRITGNQVMLGPNTKNTGTVKDALNAYKQSRMTLMVESPIAPAIAEKQNCVK